MKAQIVYIKGHSESEKQAQEALKSFNKSNLYKIVLKFIGNYENEWCKFGSIPEVPFALTR